VSPAGDTISRVWFNSRMRPCQGRGDGATPFTRSSLWGGVAHQQSARLTCERQRGQHSSLPPFSRGHSSASQSGCFTCIRSKARFLLPSPFLSLWCSPANTPASQAGDHRSEAGQGHHVQALKALSAMHSLGKRFSPVQFRVRAPIAQSSQCSSGFHKPAVSGAAPETATIVASMQQPADFWLYSRICG
jgi:hypothetical protein